MQLVVAPAASDAVIAGVSDQEVGPALAVEVVITLAAHEFVVTGAAPQEIVSFFAEKAIVTSVAKDPVLARAPDQKIVASSAPNRVVSAVAEDAVVARSSAQYVVKLGAFDHVVPSWTIGDCERQREVGGAVEVTLTAEPTNPECELDQCPTNRDGSTDYDVGRFDGSPSHLANHAPLRSPVQTLRFRHWRQEVDKDSHCLSTSFLSERSIRNS